MSDKYNSKFAEFLRVIFSKDGQPHYAVTVSKTSTWYNCAEKDVSPEHRVEEDKHKAQIAKLGWFRFMTEYLWQMITKGYDNNKFEVKAK